MTLALFRKDAQSLRPASRDAEDLLAKIKLGQDVIVEVKRPRNLQHHRKFWALMQLVADNLEGTPADTLAEVVKLRTGHVDVVKTKRGIVEIPKSISFAAMDQTAFEQFYDRAVAFILSDILPGLNKADLEREVEDVIAGRAA